MDPSVLPINNQESQFHPSPQGTSNRDQTHTTTQHSATTNPSPMPTDSGIGQTCKLCQGVGYLASQCPEVPETVLNRYSKDEKTTFNEMDTYSQATITRAEIPTVVPAPTPHVFAFVRLRITDPVAPTAQRIVHYRSLRVGPKFTPLSIRPGKINRDVFGPNTIKHLTVIDPEPSAKSKSKVADDNKT